MESSISSALTNPLVASAVAATVLSTIIVGWYLFARPPLDAQTKVMLFIGIFVLPTGAALAANVVGFQMTTQRSFCGSCHVMEPYTDDSADPTSTTLASRHARNHWFGDQNCYTCHADYQLFGTVVTKISGLSHVYFYYFTEWGQLSKEEFLKAVHINKPYTNRACLQCHSTETPFFNQVRDHKSALPSIRAGEVGCASKGCHGPAHPFSKLAKGEDLTPPPKDGPVDRTPPPEPESEEDGAPEGTEPARGAAP